MPAGFFAGKPAEHEHEGRNLTFKSTATTGASSASLDVEDRRLHENSREFSFEEESETSLGTHARRLFDMHLTWRKKAVAPRNIHSNRVLEVVSTNSFKFFINVMILLSAIQMGMAADLTDEDQWDNVFYICDFVFTTVFAIEMLMKLVGMGLTYFFDSWNWLDGFVAWVSIIDVWIMPSVMDANEEAPTILKLFRLCRLLRIVKMLRVVPELMLVVEGIVASLRSMFWVFLLLGVILYTVGIYCVEAIGSRGAGYPAWNNDSAYSDAVVDEFNNFLYFGTITRSMVSLFGLVLLSEWSPVVRPVWEKQPAIVVIFVCLVILTTFGVLNVIIGVVVERTTAAMNQVREKDVAKKKREQTKAFQLISGLMFDLDTNKDRKVSKTEMELGADNDTLHELLKRVDFPHGFTYGEFHAMLDQDGSGYLSRAEFINGMLRLVYNDQFQRDCMFQLTMGQIKSNQCKLHRETKTYIQQLYGGIKKEIEKLRSELHLPRNRRQKNDAPAGVGFCEPKEEVQSNPSKRTSDGDIPTASWLQRAGEEGNSTTGASLGLKSLFGQADSTNLDSGRLLQPQKTSASTLTDGNSGRGVTNFFSRNEADLLIERLSTQEVSELTWEPLMPESRLSLPDLDEHSLEFEDVEVETPASLPTMGTLPTHSSLPMLPTVDEEGSQQQHANPQTTKRPGEPFEVAHEGTLNASDSNDLDHHCGGEFLYSCIGQGKSHHRRVEVDANASAGYVETGRRNETEVAI